MLDAFVPPPSSAYHPNQGFLRYQLAAIYAFVAIAQGAGLPVTNGTKVWGVIIAGVLIVDIAIFASGTFCEHGFSHTEFGDSGKTGGVKYYEDGEEFVKYHSRFFCDNCKAMLQHLSAQKSHLSDLVNGRQVKGI